MTPVLFLHLPETGGSIAAAVENRLRQAGNEAVRCLPCPQGEGAPRATELLLSTQYAELIDLEATDTTLHTVMLLPTWASGAAEAARTLVKAAEATPHKTSVDILCLHSALATEADTEARAGMRETGRAVIAEIAACASRATIPCRAVVIDNFNSSGAAAGFDDTLLAAFVAELLRVMTENYADTFGRLGNPNVGGRDAVVALGLASLEFDRRAIADFLLSRAFVSALNQAEITRTKVDAQSAAQRAAACLEGVDSFYEDFYDAQVEPLIAARMPEGEIAARVREPLDEAVAALRERLTSFLDDKTLSLPEKEAVWAIILGLDNRLLGGARYRERHLSFDDALSQPIDLYVEAYNRHAAGETLLPQLGMYPAIARDLFDPTPDQAINPLPKIKALKTDMLDLTAFMRAKEKELAALNAQHSDRAMAEGHLSEDGFVWRGVQRRLDTAVAEVSLQEQYTPAEGLKPLPSVDLRKFFGPAADQGALGSCTSMAVASMMEYIVRRNNSDGTATPLSARFLFYHTNVVTGRCDEGSSYHDQLEVAAARGVCGEQLYPYTGDPSGPVPGPEAEADARRHRVVKALQIPLVTDGNHYDAMQANHALLTSALTEGYPVGIALRVFDDFANHPGGLVPRPGDDTIEHGRHGRHAMVITGYSERDKCYIVRNSWGTDFGDNGYAYISSSYIDDPELCPFACIVAETTDGTPDAPGTAVPALMAPFGATQTQINIAATRNALDEARLRLEWLTTAYNELYRYYADLMQHLCQPLVRNELRKRSEQALRLEIIGLETHREKLINEMPEKLRNFSHNYIKGCLQLSGVTLAAWGMTALFWKVQLSNTHLWLTGLSALITIITVAAWVHYKWAKRKKRRELQEEIDDVATAAGRKKRRLLTLQLRFHVAGMLVDDLHELSLKLHADYQRLVSFNNNLRCWHEEDSSHAADVPGSGQRMLVKLIDATLLDAFYQVHDADVTARIDLMDAFLHYDLSPDGMQRVRHELEQATRSAIAPLFADFTMASYIMGTCNYPYLPKADTAGVLQRLNRLSTVLTRHNAVGTPYESKYLITCVDSALRSRWLEMCSPHFAYQPMPLGTADIDRATVLTLDCVAVDDLV